MRSETRIRGDGSTAVARDPADALVGLPPGLAAADDAADTASPSPSSLSLRAGAVAGAGAGTGTSASRRRCCWCEKEERWSFVSPATAAAAAAAAAASASVAASRRGDTVGGGALGVVLALLLAEEVAALAGVGSAELWKCAACCCSCWSCWSCGW